MRRPPKRIDAKLRLANGDELPVVAFRRGRDEKGLTRYVLAYEDGSLLAMDPASITGYSMAMLPGRSSVELAFTEPS